MTSPDRPFVLVVDDDVEIREALEEHLLAAGHAVETVQNGAEAKRLLMSRRPCAIILDLWMPVMSGNELYAWLKSDPARATIPVVISTSVPRDAPLGVTVLPKPIDLPALLGWIGRHCVKDEQAPASRP